MNTSIAGSPGWWIDYLSKQLVGRETRLADLKKYMDGDAPLPEGAHGLKAAYQTFQEKARTNFAELVVEAVVERMSPCGFRVGDGEGLDKDALKIWSSNELDTISGDVHTDMLSLSDGYVIVGPPEEKATRWSWLPFVGPKNNGIPIITREDPQYIITAHDPLIPSRVVAALKMFRDEVGRRNYAYLYLPGRVYKAYQDSESAISYMSATSYTFEDEAGFPLPRGFEDVVPVVRFQNRRALGEFETHTDILDRINYMILQRLVTAALQAYRQRAIKGGEFPDYELDAEGAPVLDADGEPVKIDYADLFKPGPGALWMLPEGADFWESQYTDLTPMLSAVKDDIRDLAAVTRTPMNMLMPEGANQSAEGASFAREGLIFKSMDRIKRASYGWNKVMALALRFSGSAADVNDIETLWLPPERLSLSERADAASKLTPAGVPWKTLMTEIMQFSPEKVEEMEQERLSDALTATLAQPVVENGANG